jgi:hypothetical protein
MVARFVVLAALIVVANVPGCAGIQFADWERSSDSIPAATYSHLCEWSMCSRVRVRGSAAMGSVHYPATHQII